MGNAYRQDSQRLHELLDKASASHGATLLIPDLQRPYVWTPNQVTLLIDSLVRGWPFGTLLLWKVNHQELRGIPFRPFWTVVDRTDQPNEAQVGQMNPPAEYHMVLDGQQRIQSLLLALGGDDWGFTLEDRDWTEEIKQRRPRGRQAKYRHWSKASLCFDLHAFIAEYDKHACSLLAIDFRTVLAWAITDPQSGQSNFPKPDNYESPLPKAYATENRGRLIRLSRLWKEAQPNPALKEAQFRQMLRPLLEQHGVGPGAIDRLLQPLGELMTTLRDVKLSDVTFLELQPYDPQTWTPDTYNDAIVNIFTRLNTAGRTLTREEITFAWLKVGWETQSTSGKSAGECFSDLRTCLLEEGLELELDELVRAASFLWSVSSNDGRLLGNSDLLKGDVIRPMASELSRKWNIVQNSFLYGTTALVERGFVYGARGNFSSVYALAVIWAWLYIAEAWKSTHTLTELERDAFDKKCRLSIHKCIDRWVMCSQWAGVWSESSTAQIETYARDLTELLKSIATSTDSSQAHRLWEECFNRFVESLAPNAINNLGSIIATNRERVSLYRNLLWVWHRLDSDRWEKSQIQLRVGKKRATTEVDHIVSSALWDNKLQSAPLKEVADADEALAVANKLGNCSLLEKNFNISKSDKTLKAFLGQIHEVRENEIRIDDWCAALAISQPLLDPAVGNVEQIAEAIENRDKEIRNDLTEFIRGQKVRVDADPLPPRKTQSTGGGPSPSQMAGLAVGTEPQTDVPETRPAAIGLAQEHSPSNRTEKGHGTDFEGLRAAYREDDSVRLIVDHFASRERNQNETHVDRLETLLQRDGVTLSRSAIIRVFRRLDVLGLGRFIPGRKGYATRFEWYEKSLSIRAVATDGNGKIEHQAPQ